MKTIYNYYINMSSLTPEGETEITDNWVDTASWTLPCDLDPKYFFNSYCFPIPSQEVSGIRNAEMGTPFILTRFRSAEQFRHLLQVNRALKDGDLKPEKYFGTQDVFQFCPEVELHGGLITTERELSSQHGPVLIGSIWGFEGFPEFQDIYGAAVHKYGLRIPDVRFALYIVDDQNKSGISIMTTGGSAWIGLDLLHPEVPLT